MAAVSAPTPQASGRRDRRLPFTLYVLAALTVIKALLLFLVVAGATLTDALRPVFGLANSTEALQVIANTPGVGAILAFFGFLLLLSVIGILSRRRIGWLLAMVITGLFVAFDIYGFLTSTANHLWMALNILTVFYLNQQDVREVVGAVAEVTPEPGGGTAEA